MLRSTPAGKYLRDTQFREVSVQEMMLPHVLDHSGEYFGVEFAGAVRRKLWLCGYRPFGWAQSPEAMAQ